MNERNEFKLSLTHAEPVLFDTGEAGFNSKAKGGHDLIDYSYFRFSSRAIVETDGFSFMNLILLYLDLI